jgi:hypothetical protein
LGVFEDKINGEEGFLGNGIEIGETFLTEDCLSEFRVEGKTDKFVRAVSRAGKSVLHIFENLSD